MSTATSGARRVAELALRVLGVGALVVALVLSVRAPVANSERTVRALSVAALRDTGARTTVSELSVILAASALDSAPSRVHLTLRHVPSPAVRAALGTAAAAGVFARWTDSTRASGLVITATPVADPLGGTIVRAGATASVPLSVRDDASTLDSIASAREGLTVRGARLRGHVEAALRETRARAAVPPAPVLRRVLLFARPGWEAKFTTAALEERGWQVDGRLRVARRASVTLGRTGTSSSSTSGADGAPLDTARYAAAVVLDSGVVSAATLSRFVRQGGGVVLSGDALLGAALTVLRPATVIGERAMVPGALLTDAPRRGLAAWELRAPSRTIVLQSESHERHDDPTVVAWRVGNGRVVASAYRESWRWRMEGREDGLDAHRAWWSALVGSVAFVPAAIDSSGADDGMLDGRLPGDAAPYADLVARLGVPASEPTATSGVPPAPSRRWLLYVLATVALVVEWALRRTRGAP